MPKNDWFTVDKEGLAKLVEGRGKIALIHELISNCWDTDTESVRVRLEPIPGRAAAVLEVADDDPNGFADLAHAYTLFAESNKKGDPSKRGRFNLGEKLVLALCDEAIIATTTGTVSFGKDGSRKRSKSHTSKGSIFSATLRITRAEVEEIEMLIHDVIPPAGVTTTFNDKVIATREPLHVFETSLPTVLSDENGALRRTRRNCEVRIYKSSAPTCTSDRPGFIYEMGIPVVETGDAYDVDVQQKVPLNMDRDNVTPAYLRELRAAVLNAVVEADQLHEDIAAERWVTDALEHDSVSDDAVKDVVVKRFGAGAVSYDPSDPEANHKAVSKEVQVVHGGSLPKAAWEAVRRSGAMQPAGQVYPTHSGKFAQPEYLDVSDWTDGMRAVSDFARALARQAFDVEISVEMLTAPRSGTLADFGDRKLRFNFGTLPGGKGWFDVQTLADLERVVDLVVHELGHHVESSHLSARYHDALTKLAGVVARMFYTSNSAAMRLFDRDHL